MGDGNDTFTGSTQDQFTVDLGNGNDNYVSSEHLGNFGDIITGGAGDDSFTFIDNWGTSRITDFDAVSDAETIDLSSVSNIDDFADLLANHASQSGANVVITDGTNSLTLEGVDINDLDANDFNFVGTPPAQPVNDFDAFAAEDVDIFSAEDVDIFDMDSLL